MVRRERDNGAKIINMSFGKAFSPNKEVVDKAVKYAVSNGVLLVHAAGNDGDNTDLESNFPNRTFLKGGEAKTWLEAKAPTNFPRGRIRVFAHGSTQPLSPNSSAEGRAQNRRVEIVMGENI